MTLSLLLFISCLNCGHSLLSVLLGSDVFFTHSLLYYYRNYHPKWKSNHATAAATAAAKSLQSCPTLCDPIDRSPPGSAVPGIFQANPLDWVAISFSNAWKWKVKMKSLSRDSSWPLRLKPTRLLHPWDFPGKSTGVGCHCLLQSCNI